MNRTSLRPWFWVHVFLAFFTLAWTMTTTALGEPPPPLLLLIGIIQALIFQREWETSARKKRSEPGLLSTSTSWKQQLIAVTFLPTSP